MQISERINVGRVIHVYMFTMMILCHQPIVKYDAKLVIQQRITNIQRSYLDIQKECLGLVDKRMSTALDTISPELLAQASTSFRLQQQGLLIDGDKFDIRKFPYLRELFDMYDCHEEDMPKNVVIRKGAQMGFTVYAILSTIDRLQWLYPRAALYTFPTRDDVTDFSQSRFDRMIQDNEIFQQLIGKTDRANVKNIAGRILYLRGMRSRTQLKQIPVDLTVYDERDEMEDDMVDMAEKRMDKSNFAHTLTLSTPTFPDYGTDLSYNSARSDQRTWHIKCTHCNTWTCLEMEWPRCLIRLDDDTVIRACKKCKREVHTIHGTWVPAYPDRPMRAYYISQLNTISQRITPKVILDEYELGVNEKGERVSTREFTNQRLGMPYADIEDKLTVAQVLACCGDKPMEGNSGDDCAMGVDVKKGALHYVIGYPTSADRRRIVKFGIAPTWNTILDIGRRYHVSSCVVDAKPEGNPALEFCQKLDGAYMCYTNETQRYGSEWNAVRSEVKVNRNTSLDISHALISGGRVELPRQDDFLVKQFAEPCTRIARTIVVDDKTGAQKAVWIKLGGGDDDMRYALNFFEIACERVQPHTPKWVDKMNQTNYASERGSFMAA